MDPGLLGGNEIFAGAVGSVCGGTPVGWGCGGAPVRVGVAAGRRLVERCWKGAGGSKGGWAGWGRVANLGPEPVILGT